MYIPDDYSSDLDPLSSLICKIVGTILQFCRFTTIVNLLIVFFIKQIIVDLWPVIYNYIYKLNRAQVFAYR